MEIQAFTLGQEKEVSDLVWAVFEQYEAPDYPTKGVENFRSFIEAEHLKEMVLYHGFKIYCCFEKDQIAGVIAMRDTSHISLLFVKEEYHKKGIAKKLLAHVVQILQKGVVHSITVNSSPYARQIYKKMGFQETGELQQQDGILFIPMKMNI